MPASVMVSPSSQTAAPAAPTGQSPARRDTFWYPLPPPGRIGSLISVSSSDGPDDGLVRTSVELARGHLAAAVQAAGSTMVPFIAANAADRSSDGSAWQSEPPTVPQFRDDRVGDHALGVVQDREVLARRRADSSSCACRVSVPIRSWSPARLI